LSLDDFNENQSSPSTTITIACDAKETRRIFEPSTLVYVEPKVVQLF